MPEILVALPKFAPGDALVFFLFLCSLFVLLFLSGVNVDYRGEPPEWYGSLPRPLIRLYSLIGQLVVGSSRTRFSLLFSTRINRSALVFVWYFLAVSIIEYLFGAKFEELVSLSWGAVSIAAVLSAFLFLCEGGSARTVTCAFCLSGNGPKKNVNADEDSEKYLQYDNPYCFYDSKQRPAPCRPGHLSWPGIFSAEVKEGEPDPRPIRIAAEQICQDNEYACCAEKRQVDLNTGTCCFGRDKGGCRDGDRSSNTAQRNEDLSERCGLERVGVFRVAGKPAGNGSDTENSVLEMAASEIGASDTYQAGRFAEGNEAPKMSYFVENDVEPAKEKDLGYNANGKKIVEVHGELGNSCGEESFGNLRELLHKAGLLLMVALYLLVLPAHLGLLLPVAIRSRFDWWVDRCTDQSKTAPILDWKAGLGFLAWTLTWAVDLFVLGSMGAVAVRFMLERLLVLGGAGAL